MKKFRFISYFTFTVVGLLTTALVSCERELSDEATLATFPTTPDVFTDFPVGLTDAFFVSFDPADGANVNGFGVDTDAYKGTSAIRIEVPAETDSDGAFIGGIFLDRNAGRNLTDYNALTFWAKGSTTASVGLFGFGTDFLGDKYSVGLTDVTLSTAWKKYTIPIPDASKLVQEKGMFAFSAGTEDTNGLGYSIFIDEIRFEKLGTIAQPRPAIFNGEDVTAVSFIGITTPITGSTQTFNLANGTDVTVSAAIGYFDFVSSDPSVVQVNKEGVIRTVGVGQAVITASLNGIDAKGSLTINSKGEFYFPDAPTHAATDVVSIFSDAYTNVNIDFYNGYWQPWQETTSADFDVNGDNILAYENFNFVGHQFSKPTVDVSSMTHLHIDVFVPETLNPGAQLKITIKDFGGNNIDGKGDKPVNDDTTQAYVITTANLAADAWSSIEIPLSLNPRNRVGQIIYENNGSNLTNLYFDNIYFHK